MKEYQVEAISEGEDEYYTIRAVNGVVALAEARAFVDHINKDRSPSEKVWINAILDAEGWVVWDLRDGFRN